MSLAGDNMITGKFHIRAFAISPKMPRNLRSSHIYDMCTMSENISAKYVKIRVMQNIYKGEQKSLLENQQFTADILDTMPEDSFYFFLLKCKQVYSTVIG